MNANYRISAASVGEVFVSFRKMLRVVSAAVVLTLLAGCTHTQIVSRTEAEVQRLREELAGKTAEIVTANRAPQPAEQLFFAADSLRWTNPQRKTSQSVSLDRIQEIHHVRAGRGALEGGAIGFGTGFALGFVAGISSGDDASGFVSFQAEEKGLIIGSILGLGGAVLGLTAGAIQGSRDVYRFDPPPGELSSSSSNARRCERARSFLAKERSLGPQPIRSSSRTEPRRPVSEAALASCIDERSYGE